jgi:hypothetical protein
VALTLLRELAPLITAIIVAGRTGSSYTAQIGAMQVTEEVDALRTIGIRPMRRDHRPGRLLSGLSGARRRGQRGSADHGQRRAVDLPGDRR